MMRRLLLIIALVMISVTAQASGLALTAFPKIPHAVQDACWIDSTLFLMAEDGVYTAAIGKEAWDIHKIISRGASDIFWSMTCGDLLPAPGEELVISRVRNGVWRSYVLTQTNGAWSIVLDEVPFELRRTQWQGAIAWVGDAHFPQDTARGEFFLVEVNESKLKLGKRIRLPRGSVLDNWVEISADEVVVLRGHHTEVFGDGPRPSPGTPQSGVGDQVVGAERRKPKWKFKQKLAGGSLTTLCAESQPWVMSSIGVMACRQLAPLYSGGVLIAAHNKLLVDEVVGRVPMIEHSEVDVFQLDPALGLYQSIQRQGPLMGELAAYFIDKNPVDKRDTLFLVIQVRTGAEAVGGLTRYSLLVPMSLESLGK